MIEGRPLRFLSRNLQRPSRFAELRAGDNIHTLTDGEWSLLDGVKQLLRAVGPSHFLCATWTLGYLDMVAVRKMLERGEVLSVRFMVDRSFKSRHPGYCLQLLHDFTAADVRVWSSHAKFVCLTGGAFDVIVLTTANLNKNKRIENFSVCADRELTAAYIGIADDIWRAQGDMDGFDNPADVRRMQDAVMQKGKRTPRRKTFGGFPLR